MKTNDAISAVDIRLERQRVPSDQLVSGEPHTASAVLGEFAGVEVGVWEMTAGVMRDVEADEIFVVLAGSATVEFADGSAALHLGVGDVVRLASGSETVWTVHETLRKVYLS